VRVILGRRRFARTVALATVVSRAHREHDHRLLALVSCRVPGAGSRVSGAGCRSAGLAATLLSLLPQCPWSGSREAAASPFHKACGLVAALDGPPAKASTGWGQSVDLGDYRWLLLVALATVIVA
jgi:hypothetical protein